MRTDVMRGLMLRVLPVLLAILFAIAGFTAAPAEVSSVPEGTEDVAPVVVPEDRTVALVSQFAAGVRGSRAPPAFSA